MPHKCPEARKAYLLANKEKRAIQAKEWREANKERHYENHRKWVEANKEYVAQKEKEYRQARRDHTSTIRKTYRKNNCEYFAAASAKRRSSKLQRTPSWITDIQLAEIKSFYIESEIRTRLTGVQHHVDHIYPLQGKDVSGLHVPWNLQVLTATENLNKKSLPRT